MGGPGNLVNLIAEPTLASAEDYFVKLTRLETDGLPRYEAVRTGMMTWT